MTATFCQISVAKRHNLVLSNSGGQPNSPNYEYRCSYLSTYLYLYSYNRRDEKLTRRPRHFPSNVRRKYASLIFLANRIFAPTTLVTVILVRVLFRRSYANFCYAVAEEPIFAKSCINRTRKPNRYTRVVQLSSCPVFAFYAYLPTRAIPQIASGRFKRARPKGWKRHFCWLTDEASRLHLRRSAERAESRGRGEPSECQRSTEAERTSRIPTY